MSAGHKKPAECVPGRRTPRRRPLSRNPRFSQILETVLCTVEDILLECTGVHPLKCPLDADLLGELQLASAADTRLPGLIALIVLALEPHLEAVVDPLEGDLLAALVLGGFGDPGSP